MARPLLASMLTLSLALLSCDLSSPLAAAPAPADIAVAESLPQPVAAAEVVPVELPTVRPLPQVALIADYLDDHEMGLSSAEKNELARTIVEAAHAHRFEPWLVLAVIRVESRFDPFAVSPAGAFGLMQIRPPTGEELAGRLGLPWHGTRTLFDPVANVRLGVAYLEQLRERFGDLRTALAAYNWGPGHIGRRLRRGRAVPAAYSNRVLDNYTEFTHRAS